MERWTNSVTINGIRIDTDNKLRPGAAIHGRGTIVRTYEGLEPHKQQCEGCRDDFYNGQGAAECWMFKTAKVVDKVGHSSIRVCGGVDTIMEKTLSCWHGVRK